MIPPEQAVILPAMIASAAVSPASASPAVAWLAAAALALVLGHVVPSAPPVRRRLIDVLGRGGFVAGYSVLSLALLAWVVVAWREAAGGPWLWAPPPGARWITVGAMPVALWLVASALLDRPAAGEARRGAFRLTPAPGSLGVMLWAGLHLLSVGSARGVILFGALALLGLATLTKASWLARRPADAGAPPPRRRRRPGWLAPVLAPVLAAGLWALLLALHPVVIGVDPLAALPS